MSERPVLIVDGANLFIRSWAAYPQMTSNGDQFGGVIGFLKTLAKLVREQSPSMVLCAWEGGGSQRRRSIFKEYKLGRRPEKLNRFYGDDIPDNDENRKHQLLVLINSLKHVPICQLYASDCEGDDIIAYLCNGPMKDRKRVIASSDKDLYQLLDNNTIIYSLHKKIYVTSKTMFEEFHIKPHNFAVAKALCGDKGDNVPGIKGLGFKTASKLLPMLSGDQVVLLEDVLNYCYSHRDDHKMYGSIINNINDVKRNYRLVYLNGNMLSSDQQDKVNSTVNTFMPHMDRLGLLKKLLDEGVSDFDVQNFAYAFNCIVGIKN